MLSRERPAVAAACARACGPAVAAPSGRASVPRGKPKRADPGGFEEGARARPTDSAFSPEMWGLIEYAPALNCKCQGL